jgi:alpha-methylacyl-CoA racemase
VQVGLCFVQEISELDGWGLAGRELPEHLDRAGWPRLREIFTEMVARHPRDHWAALFDGADACVTPISAAASSARASRCWLQRKRRGIRTSSPARPLVEIDGAVQAAPAPRFSRTPAGPSGTPVRGVG